MGLSRTTAWRALKQGWYCPDCHSRSVRISRERGASIIWEPAWQERIALLKKEHLRTLEEERISTEHREVPERFNPCMVL